MNPKYKYQTLQETKVKEGVWLLAWQCVLQRLHRMRVLTVIPFLLPLFSPFILYLFVGIPLASLSFSCWFFVPAMTVISLIFISQSCRVLWKAVIDRTVACLCLWSQHSSRGLGDSTRCQWRAYISMTTLLFFAPLCSSIETATSENTVGRQIKWIQTIQAANPLFEITTWLGERLSFKYIFQTVSCLARMGRKIRERWYSKNAVLNSFMKVKVEGEIHLIPRLWGPVGILSVIMMILHVELVPHGYLFPGVPQHFFPMVPLCACDMQAQTALAKHMALASSVLAQHFQLHAGGTQELMRHLKHDHLIPHRVDLVLCTFGLLLLQLQWLMPQCHLDRNICIGRGERRHVNEHATNGLD